MHTQAPCPCGGSAAGCRSWCSTEQARQSREISPVSGRRFHCGSCFGWSPTTTCQHCGGACDPSGKTAEPKPRLTRADYIRAHYSLTCADGVWVARCTALGVGLVISGDEREAVVSRARREWGHFFWSDEAEAFDEIFRRAS